MALMSTLGNAYRNAPMIQLFLEVTVSQLTVLLSMDALAVQDIAVYNAIVSTDLAITIPAHTM